MMVPIGLVRTQPMYNEYIQHISICVYAYAGKCIFSHKVNMESTHLYNLAVE